MGKRALEHSRFFVDQQLGDPHITVADLQERLARGDTFTDKLYFGANLPGTAQYWHKRRRELRVLVEFMLNEKRELPSFFMTGLEAVPSFTFLLLEGYLKSTSCRPKAKKSTLLKIAMPSSRQYKKIIM